MLEKEMVFNEEKAYEEVANQLKVAVELIVEEGRFFNNSYDLFFDIYDDLDYGECIDLLKQAVATELNSEESGTVADKMIGQHDNVFRTPYGYVYFNIAELEE